MQDMKNECHNQPYMNFLILSKILLVNDPDEPAARPLMRSVTARVCRDWLQMSLYVSARKSICPQMFWHSFKTKHISHDQLHQMMCGPDVHLHARLRAAGHLYTLSFDEVCLSASPMLISRKWIADMQLLSNKARILYWRYYMHKACESGNISVIRALIIQTNQDDTDLIDCALIAVEYKNMTLLPIIFTSINLAHMFQIIFHRAAQKESDVKTADLAYWLYCESGVHYPGARIATISGSQYAQLVHPRP